MKFVLGCILAAVVCFAWGFMSWGVLGWHMNGIHSFRDEADVAKVIKANVTHGHGYYVLPNMDQPSSVATPAEKKAYLEDQAESRNAGPFVYAIVRPGKREWNMSTAMIRSGVRALMAAILMALLLRQTTVPYAGRVTFAALVGLFSGVVCDMPQWIWFEEPTRDFVVNLADHLIEWTLAGAVLGFFVGKEPTAADTR